MKITAVVFLLMTLSFIAAAPQEDGDSPPADAPADDAMSPAMDGMDMGMDGMDMGMDGMNGMDMGMDGSPQVDGSPDIDRGMDDDSTTTTAAPGGDGASSDMTTNEDLKMTLDEILELLKEHAMKGTDMDDAELNEILDKLKKNPKLMKKVAEALWWDASEEDSDEDIFGFIFDLFDWRKK